MHLFKKKNAIKHILLSIPIALVLLLVFLVIVCRWENTSEGWRLFAPYWLGGYSQWTSYFGTEAPTLFTTTKALLSNAFSPLNVFIGESIYANTLFGYPGLIIWIISVFGLSRLTRFT